MYMPTPGRVEHLMQFKSQSSDPQMGIVNKTTQADQGLIEY